MDNRIPFDDEADDQPGQLAHPGQGATGSPFDGIRREDERGEHWMGRDLQPLMDYGQWARFEAVIKKAKKSYALVQGQAAADAAFMQVNQVAHAGNLGEQGRRDFRLTRLGAYLTAIAGDDTKDAVAHARVYFAVRTRQAEIAEESGHKKELPSYPEALRRWANEIEAREAAEKRAAIEKAGREAAEEENAILGPKAAEADHIRSADGLMTLSDFANRLKSWAVQNLGVTIKHKDVFDFLGEINFICRGDSLRNNRPKAFAIDRDFIRQKESEYPDKNGNMRVSYSSRLTTSGCGWAWDRAVTRLNDFGTLRKPMGGAA